MAQVRNATLTTGTVPVGFAGTTYVIGQLYPTTDPKRNDHSKNPALYNDPMPASAGATSKKDPMGKMSPPAATISDTGGVLDNSAKPVPSIWGDSGIAGGGGAGLGVLTHPFAQDMSVYFGYGYWHRNRGG